MSDELAGRCARAVEAMAAAELDALVVAGRGSIGQYGFVEYLCGYTPLARYAYVVLSSKQDPVVIMPTAADRYFAARESGFDVRAAGEGDIVSGADGLATTVATILCEADHAADTIGVVGLNSIVPVGAYQTWREGLNGASFVDATGLLAEIKAVKSPAELREIEAAMATADAGLTVVADRLRPGVTGWELRSEIERQIRLDGVRFSFIFVSACPFFIAPPTGEPFRKGDLVTAYVEITSATGYWVELARLYAIGDLHPEAEEVAQACLRGADRAEQALTVGGDVASVATVLNEEAGKIGARSGIWHGHGIGIDHDAPVITAQATEQFQRGAAIAIHPNLNSRSGRFGASVADTYVLSAEGTRNLSTLPRELKRIIWHT